MAQLDNSLLKQTFRSLEPSATLAINEQSAALERAGKRPTKLGLGQSPFPVPPHVVERLRAHSDEKDYLPVQGLPQLRKAICDWHERTHGLQFEPHQIMIGPGSKELLYLLQLVSNTETYLPSPSWVSYAPQSHMVGGAVHWIPTTAASNFMLSEEMLEQSLNTTQHRPLLILNSPSNPVGRMLSADTCLSISTVMRKKRGIILSDEIYGGVAFGAPHISPAHSYPEGTIISGGLSKWCGAGGWRLGYMAFPESLTPLLNAMCAAASETFTSVSAPVQYGAVAAYESTPQMDDYLHHSNRVLRLTVTRFYEALAEFGVNAPVPQGGFYLFPSFQEHRNTLAERHIFDDRSLCEALLKDVGIAALPGQCFGRDPTELLLRMSIVDFDGEQALSLSRQVDDDSVLLNQLLDANPALTSAPSRMRRWLTDYA